MEDKQYKDMSHEQLSLEYFNHLIGLDVSLFEYFITARGFENNKIGRHAAKIVLNFNMLACAAIAELYMKELAVGNKKADLFEPNLVDLNIEYTVE